MKQKCKETHCIYYITADPKQRGIRDRNPHSQHSAPLAAKRRLQLALLLRLIRDGRGHHWRLQGAPITGADHSCTHVLSVSEVLAHD